MSIDLIGKAELRLAAAEPLFRPLDQMKASAERLKEILSDPLKEEQLNRKVSDEFGINLT